MVDDVPPYWIYLPRNLSYVGDQVWDYFICCKRRAHGRMSVEWNPDDEAEVLTPENVEEDTRDILGEEKDAVLCNLLDGVKMQEPKDVEFCDGDSGLTNSLSDESDVTIPDNRLEDFIPVLSVENDGLDDARSDADSDAAFADDYLNGFDHVTVNIDHVTGDVDHVTVNGMPEVAELPVKAKTVDVKSRSEMALNLFKDQADGKKMSFLDLLAPGDDDNEDEFPAPELRRSTSLKTTKTPPGTPRRKKAVRFADAFGLDLEHVRHVLNLDSPPRIPVSAVQDLRTGIEKDRIGEGNKYLNALFPQPGADNLFIQRVLTQKVSLENAMINNLTITGTIRVANIAFHKSVFIRYTTDNWKEFTNVMASYVQNSCDGATDRFSFNICSHREMDVGEKLQFAVCFEAAGQSFWDSNAGNNYVFECFAKTVPALSSDNAWLHFL